MVFGDHDRSNLRYEDSQPSNAPRYLHIILSYSRENTNFYYNH